MAARRPFDVGFIGLGAMGHHMARRIGSLFRTGVWNRTAMKAQEHSANHGTVFVENLEDMDCPVIFCCLPTSDEVREVAGKLPAWRPSSSSSAPPAHDVVSSADAHPDAMRAAMSNRRFFVDCTSGDHGKTVEIGTFLRREKGITMLDCPVSGGPRGAEQGIVTAMLGADSGEDVDMVLPFVKQFAKNTSHVGPLGSAHAVKAMNNIMNTAHLALATEGLIALQRAGVPPAAALACINKSSGRSLQTELRLPEEVLSRRFGYGFKLQLMRKDVRIALGILGDHFPDATILPAVAELMERAGDRYAGESDADYTFISKYLEETAGAELGGNAIGADGQAADAVAQSAKN
jgi:3-hydroxyisobutyrate dehydrogenase